MLATLRLIIHIHERMSALFHLLQTPVYTFNQLRAILPSDATGHLKTVELSIEYHTENLKDVEVWVSISGDNVRGRICTFEAKNKDITPDRFNQSLFEQVNDMPDIDKYIHLWISRRLNEGKFEDRIKGK
jgi:hypothetical protein